jgi:prephenate dehydrogenase
VDRFLPIVQPPTNQGAEPVFQRVGIVGLGLIGGSIALAARQLWPSALVIGVDAKDVLEKAMVLHAIDVAADDPVVLAEADLVILSAPVRENERLLSSLPEHVVGPAVVTDVGSTKRSIVDAARGLPGRLTFVGGHPLGGAARQGIDFARPDLFKGRPWIFTPGSAAGREPLERLFAFASALGAMPTTMAADEHDRLLAYISHLPQLVASALMKVVGEAVQQEGLKLSGRGLADTTRLASSSASIWADVCQTNDDEIGSALDELISLLTEIRADLRSPEAVRALFDSANDWKRRLTDL